jgi:hypothetical protein
MECFIPLVIPLVIIGVGVGFYLHDQYKKGRSLAEKYTGLIDRLAHNPIDRETHDALFQLFYPYSNRAALRLHDITINGMYSIALENLRRNPRNSDAKVFALNMGRLFYSSTNDGTPTLIDEQAIANDIAAHSD